MVTRIKPDSIFTKGPMATLATPTGRVIMAGGRLEIVGPGRNEDRILEEEDIPRILKTYFNIELNDG